MAMPINPNMNAVSIAFEYVRRTLAQGNVGEHCAGKKSETIDGEQLVDPRAGWTDVKQFDDGDDRHACPDHCRGGGENVARKVFWFWCHGMQFIESKNMSE